MINPEDDKTLKYIESIYLTNPDIYIGYFGEHESVSLRINAFNTIEMFNNGKYERFYHPSSILGNFNKQITINEFDVEGLIDEIDKLINQYKHDSLKYVSIHNISGSVIKAGLAVLFNSLDNVNFDNYICPGCSGKEKSEHKCVFKNLKSGEWLIDYRTDGPRVYYPNKCNCPTCYPDRASDKNE